jgi:hypothetical protein
MTRATPTLSEAIPVTVIDAFDVENVSPEVGPVIAIVGRVESGPVLPPPVEPPSVGGGVVGGGVDAPPVEPPVVAFMIHVNCCEAVSVPSLARAVTL